MSPTNKNNKSSGGPTKRYTTRQIMELTEKRRKQMDEEARLEALERESKKTKEVPQAAQQENPKPSGQSPVRPASDPVAVNGPVLTKHEVPVVAVREVKEPPVTSSLQQEEGSLRSFHDAIEQFTRQVIAHPARFEFPPQEMAKPPQKQADAPLPQEEVSSAGAIDGKTVAAVFREDPKTPSEKQVSEMIAEEFDKAMQDVVSLGTNARAELSEIILDRQQQDTRDRIRIHNTQQGLRRFREAVITFLEWAWTLASSLLLVLMFAHVIVSGLSRHYYDPSPFVGMMALTALWLNRRYLERRTEWFWGSTVIIAGGMGVFYSAALQGFAYIELAGFLTVCLGIFMWRYQEESALRLFFPLVCLCFMLAPPDWMEQQFTFRLNTLVYSLAANILNSFHLPTLFDQDRFYVGPGVIGSFGDTAVFRSIFSSLALGAVCVSFQNMSAFWSFSLLSSAVLWSMLGNILRVALTGMMLENFGVEYASIFFAEYSVVIVLAVTIAGLMLTAGLLPHREEE